MSAIIELEIGAGPEPGTYSVRVLRSAGSSSPSATFRLDVDPLVARLPLLDSTVLASAVPARRVLTAGETEIQRVGTQLFTSVFTEDIETAYRTSRAVASARGQRLQVRLRLLDPALAALPWEALYDPDAGAYVSRKDPLIRQIPSADSIEALSLDSPLRILGMVSSPRNLPTIDAENERTRLERALGPHIAAGRILLEWLDDVTWSNVHEKLLSAPWHVLHFVGHGSYETATDEGVLAFVGQDGRAESVDASALADLLDQAEPTPRLVVINSCMSGTTGTDELFSGTAAALVRSGIHAVAAMQFTISDGAALAFSQGFYSALAYGRGIDEAMVSGRVSILGMSRDTLEWVTPVLCLRGEDTRLFDVTAVPAAPAGVDAPVDEVRAVPPPPPTPVPTPVPTPMPTRDAAPDVAPPPVLPKVEEEEEEEEVQPRPPIIPPDVPPPDLTREPEPDPQQVRRRRRTILIAAGAGLVAVAAGVAIVAGLLNSRSTGEASDVSDGAVDSFQVDVPGTLTLDAENTWSPGAIGCAAGKRLLLTTTGEVQDGADHAPDADGVSGSFSEGDPLPDAHHLSLVGRFGESGDVFAVGRRLALTCPPDGSADLQLGINDAEPTGNAGIFEVAIADATVDPAVADEVRTPVATEVWGARQDPTPWTPTGIMCVPGAVYRVTATGQIGWDIADPALTVGPDGLDPAPTAFQPSWNLPGLGDAAHAALVGSIDGAEPYTVLGTQGTFECGDLTGQLHLGVNDTNVSDNSDKFEVVLTRVTTGG